MTPWVRWLLVTNIAVFVIQLAVPLTGWLAFVPDYALFRPWTLVTYMFAHDTGGFSHIFWNVGSPGTELEFAL